MRTTNNPKAAVATASVAPVLTLIGVLVGLISHRHEAPGVVVDLSAKESMTRDWRVKFVDILIPREGLCESVRHKFRMVACHNGADRCRSGALLAATPSIHAVEV
jgi:hypothetical protein